MKVGDRVKWSNKGLNNKFDKDERHSDRGTVTAVGEYSKPIDPTWAVEWDAGSCNHGYVTGWMEWALEVVVDEDVTPESIVAKFLPEAVAEPLRNDWALQILTELNKAGWTLSRTVHTEEWKP